MRSLPSAGGQAPNSPRWRASDSNVPASTSWNSRCCSDARLARGSSRNSAGCSRRRSYEKLCETEVTLVVRDSSLRQPPFRMTEKPAFSVILSRSRGEPRHDTPGENRAATCAQRTFNGCGGFLLRSAQRRISFHKCPPMQLCKNSPVRISLNLFFNYVSEARELHGATFL
jgi:hypothetical protein